MQNAETRATTTTDKKIGARIRARRRELRISQEALAEKLGVTFQQVQKYEKGTNRICITRFIDICDILDISVSEALQGLAHPKDLMDQPEAAALETVDGRRLILQFTQLKHPMNRKALVVTAEALVRAEAKA